MFKRRHSNSTNTSKSNKNINRHKILSTNDEEASTNNMTGNFISFNIVEESKKAYEDR